MLIQREQCSDTSGSLFNTTVDCDVQNEVLKGRQFTMSMSSSNVRTEWH